ncbi:hypothetical protein KM043_001602 [Ampulex compressa]|nr:hypothetical protein KM043_001602 [Ampulex compressa]
MEALEGSALAEGAGGRTGNLEDLRHWSAEVPLLVAPYRGIADIETRSGGNTEGNTGGDTGGGGGDVVVAVVVVVVVGQERQRQRCGGRTVAAAVVVVEKLQAGQVSFARVCHEATVTTRGESVRCRLRSRQEASAP